MPQQLSLSVLLLPADESARSIISARTSCSCPQGCSPETLLLSCLARRSLQWFCYERKILPLGTILETITLMPEILQPEIALVAFGGFVHF